MLSLLETLRPKALLLSPHSRFNGQTLRLHFAVSTLISCKLLLKPALFPPIILLVALSLLLLFPKCKQSKPQSDKHNLHLHHKHEDFMTTSMDRLVPRSNMALQEEAVAGFRNNGPLVGVTTKAAKRATHTNNWKQEVAGVVAEAEEQQEEGGDMMVGWEWEASLVFMRPLPCNPLEHHLQLAGRNHFGRCKVDYLESLV